MSALISILMPAFNAEKTVAKAIRSCLDQTFTDFELIILNNGSTDATGELISSFSDQRIRRIDLAENAGIAAARNRLLREAKGEFIAWLDADDQMLPKRLEAQLEFFRAHPETDVLGSWIRTDNRELPVKKLPLEHHQIITCLWFKNTLIQPSVMSRNFYGKENISYDEGYGNSVEDYDLWYRLSRFKHFANIPQFLTLYHMTTGVDLDMKKRASAFETNLYRLWEQKWKDFPLELNRHEKKIFQFFLYNNRTLTTEEIRAVSKALKKMSEKRNDRFFRLILSFHYLRLWRNMKVFHKMMNLHLLKHFTSYPEMKKTFLV